MELAFRRWPNPQNPQLKSKILLLHGMGGTGSLWRPLAAGLEQQFDLLAPDQRGHGMSRVPAFGPEARSGYTPLDYGRDLVDTLEAHSFHPCWVLGHSMGVRSACALAYLKPDWVQGLILIDLGFSGPAGGGLGTPLAQFIGKLPDHFSSRLEARSFMSAHCPDPSIAQYLLAVSVTTEEGVHFPFDRGALIRTIDAARDVSVRAWVEKYADTGKPIWVIRGEKSLIWSHEDFEKEQAHFKSYPAVHFAEYPDAGHGLPFEKRKELTQWLRDTLI